MTDPLTDREFTRRVLKALLVTVGIAALLTVMWVARRAFAIIYVSALVAIAISPLVQRIENSPLRRRGRAVPRSIAILVIYVTFVAAVGLIALLIVPPLVNQAAALWAAAPEHFARARDALFRAGLISRNDFTLKEAVQQAPSAASGGTAANTVSVVLAAGSTVAGGAFGIITTLILSFYFLVEAPTLFETVLGFAPDAQRPVIMKAAGDVVAKVSAWMQANLILGGVMGLLSAVILGPLGEPFFYVVALVSAMGEVIPILGPLIAGVVAVALALTKSAKLALIVGLLYVGLHELEANVLVPKIMQARVGVNPVVVMIAVLIGFELFGVFGAVLAIPTAAIISVLVNEFLTPKSIVQ